MRQLYTVNHQGAEKLAVLVSKLSDAYIDAMLDLEEKMESGNQTTILINGQELTLGAEDFDPIKIAY
jgi:dsDNA-binding SOS-regulon protein